MDNIDISELMNGAESCVRIFMNVSKGDKVLIITDNTRIAEALAKASDKVEAEVTVFYLPNALRPMKRLCETLKSAILQSTVIFTPFDGKAEEFFFRQQIVALANKEGGRKIAHMPSVTPDMFKSTGMLSLNTEEMEKMKKLTEKLAKLLSATKGIKIRSVSYGETNLSVELEGWSRSGIISTGHVIRGSWENLPSGEAFVLPKKGTASGRIVVDKAISYVSGNKLPLTMDVTSGVIDIDSIKGRGAKSLKDLINYPGDDAKTVCEFGIGTNPKEIVSYAPIEIEKMVGTIHIAIGNNAIFGGDIEASVPHIDMVVMEPIVTVSNLLSQEINIIEGGEIKEDRIDSFFKIPYTAFSDRLNVSATIRRVKDIKVDVKGNLLYRCWKDHRGHDLCIQVGNDDTARKAKDVWDCIDSTRNAEEMREILKKYNKRFGSDDTLFNQLLHTLEKFGIIKITES